jgi:hypothetical protein
MQQLKACFDPTHGQPLGVIGLASAEEGLEGVVGRDDEAGGVDEELSSDVEEDQEEVQGTEAWEHWSAAQTAAAEGTWTAPCRAGTGGTGLHDGVGGQSRLEAVVRADRIAATYPCPG